MRMMGKGAIAILPAAPERQRNSDVHYHYRPDSDFHYLTGFDEPEAVAVLIPGRAQAEYILFVRDRDPDARDLGRQARRSRRRGRAITAPTMPSRSATSTTSCRACIEQLRARLLHDGRAPGVRPARDRLGEYAARPGQAGMHTPQEFVALDHLLHDMRLYKSRDRARR